MSADVAHPLDDLAVYALDALDDTERTLVDGHLATCAACRTELDQHLATLSHLTIPDAPPPELWDRIARQVRAMPRGADTGDVAAVGGGGGQVIPLAPPRKPGPPPPVSGSVQRIDEWEPRHRARRRSGLPGQSTWLAAVAAVAVLLAGISGVVVLSRRGGDSPATVEELAAAAADDPDSTVVTLSSTTGSDEARARVVMGEGPTGYVLLDRMPRLTAGHAYQVWDVDNRDAPVSLGVVGDGSTGAAAIAIAEGTRAFAISDEADPNGVPAPLGPIVVSGTRA